MIVHLPISAAKRAGTRRVNVTHSARIGLLPRSGKHRISVTWP